MLGKVAILCCVRGLFGFVVAIDVTIEVLRKSCDLCVVFVCLRRCCDRSCDRDFVQKFRSLCCIRVCVVVVVIAIKLTIEILCKTCDFLCGGRACVRACVSFVFEINAKVAIFVLWSRASRFFQDV